MASSSLNEWPSLSTEHHNDISLHHRKLRDDFSIVNQYLEDNGEISIPKHHFKLLFNSYQKLSEKLSEITMTKTDMKMGIDTTDEQDSVHTTTFTGKSTVEDEVGVHAASFVERPTIEDEDCVHATNAIERSIIEDQDRINATKITKISRAEDKDRVYATDLTEKPTIEHKDRAHDADLIDLPTTKDKNSFSDIDLMEKPRVEDKGYAQDTNLVKNFAVQYEDCVHDTDLMKQLRVGEKDCVHTTDVMDRSTNTTSKASDSGNLVNLPKCESYLEPSIAVSIVTRESRRLPLGLRNHRDHLTYRPLHPGEKADHPSYGVIV